MNEAEFSALVEADALSCDLLDASKFCLLLFHALDSLTRAANLESLRGEDACLASLQVERDQATDMFVKAAQKSKPLFGRFAKAASFPVHTHLSVSGRSAHELVVKVGAACLAAWNAADAADDHPTLVQTLAEFGRDLSRIRPLIEREAATSQDKRVRELLSEGETAGKGGGGDVSRGDPSDYERYCYLAYSAAEAYLVEKHDVTSPRQKQIYETLKMSWGNQIETEGIPDWWTVPDTEGSFLRAYRRGKMALSKGDSDK